MYSCLAPLLYVLTALDRAGNPPRRAGHFGARITSLREVSSPPLRDLLVGQKKVTKEEALNIRLDRG